MATTATEHSVYGEADRGPARKALIAAVAGTLSAGSALAQTWRTEAFVGGQVTITNNANFEDSTNRDGDVILNVEPGIRFSREGGRLRLNGFASVNAIGYVQGTETSRLLPRAAILGELEAIERFFFIEGGLNVNQELLNPFVPRSDANSTFNKYTYGQVQLAPYIKGNLGQNLQYLVRSDNSYTFTTQSTTPLSNAYYGRHFGEIVRPAEPLGWSVRAEAEITNIRDQVQPSQRLETALARVFWAATPQLTIGARGGYESTNYTAEDESGPIYGADIDWAISPVTRLAGYWENRFFGPKYQFNASHRGPQLASSFAASRQVTTYPQLFLTIPQTGNVAGLLDAVLIARFPDPIERAAQVQDLIARQGLPESIPGSVNIYSQNANVNTNGSANFALIGVRNTLALLLYYGKTEELPDARIPPTFLLFNNNRQQGATVSLSHRLTPQGTLTALARYGETRGIDANADDYTNQAVTQLQYTYQLLPRSSVFVGARYQVTASNVSTDSTEAALLGGFFHTF
jgi:uncharacterized protein (PEP-CTERM system associated)